jgi:hypothetical protein
MICAEKSFVLENVAKKIEVAGSPGPGASMYEGPDLIGPVGLQKPASLRSSS